MRLFTGIALPPNVAGKLAATLDELRPTARINWSPVENLHITCKFIGEWQEDRLGELKQALEAVRARGPISISVAGFGFFPNLTQPRSFFAEVQASSGLNALVVAIDQILEPLECAPETRPYKPHITLARIKAVQNLRNLHTRIEGTSDSGFGGFDCRQFHLYQSVPSPRGSIYTKLATYDLMRETPEIQ